MKRRLQNRIAESALTLPIAAVLATLLWWLPLGGYASSYLHAWIAAAALSYFVIEGTSVNALLRTRSQMIPSLLLLLLAVCGFLHGDAPALEVTLALMLTIFCIMQTAPRSSSAEDIASAHGIGSSRSRYRPQVSTLHAYCALSLGSLVWPPMLLLAIPLLWSQSIYLRSMTWRCLGAAVIGLALPYFFWGAAVLFAETLPTAVPEALSAPFFLQHCEAIIAPISVPLTTAINGKLPLPDTYSAWFDNLTATVPDASPSGSNLSPPSHPSPPATWATVLSLWAATRIPRLSALILIAILALTGFIHYLRKSYDDKIRVRVCHQTILTLQFFVALWLALQPQHFRFLFPLLLLTTAPSAAHFITFTRTWTTNAWVILLTIGMIIVGILNLVPNIELYLADLNALLLQYINF